MSKVRFRTFFLFSIVIFSCHVGFAVQLVSTERLHPAKGCVVVPENPQLVEGVSISLCYQWLNTYDPDKQTFIFLVGGPGAGFSYYLKFRDFWLNTKLGQKYNILFFDPRGVASSSEINANSFIQSDLRQYTLTNMTNDIESLRKKLLGEQSVGLIGHSTGGHQVFDYAIRFPGHVFEIISLHGGVSGLGFLTQTYYRLSEWQKAGVGIDSAKLVRLQQLIQSGAACDQDGSKLSTTAWSQISSFALYGTVPQRQILPGLLDSLIQGNVESKHFCKAVTSSAKKLIPDIPSNDPLNAMAGINLIINQNVVCSNFITKGAVSSLPSPFYDPTFSYIWSTQCLPLLSNGKIVENQFDLRHLIPKIKVPIMIVGANRDQWIPFAVQKEIWQNMSASQTEIGKIAELNQCGHFSFYECPDQLKSALDEFVE